MKQKTTRRTRSIGALLFVVLACALFVLVVGAVWARTTLLDTDAFIEVVEPTLSSDEVATALGDFVAGEAIEVLDLEQRFEQRLGAVDQFLGQQLADALDLGPRQRALLGAIDLPSFASLAAPLAQGVEERIRERSQQLVRSDLVQDALPALVAKAHGGAVAVLRGDLEGRDNVAVVDGKVRLDLAAVVATVLAELSDDGPLASFALGVAAPSSLDEDSSSVVSRLGSALGRQLPDDFGTVTVMSSTTLVEWQRAVRIVERLVVLLIVLLVASVVAALWISPRRRRTTVQLAFGFGLGMVATNALLDRAETAVGVLVGAERGELVGAVVSEVLSGLRATVLALAISAFIVSVAAFLVGQPWFRGALQDRALDSESGLALAVRGHTDAFYFGGFAMAAIALVVVGLSWLSLLVISALLGVYLGLLRLAAPADVEATDERKTVPTA